MTPEDQAIVSRSLHGLRDASVWRCSLIGVSLPVSQSMAPVTIVSPSASGDVDLKVVCSQLMYEPDPLRSLLTYAMGTKHLLLLEPSVRRRDASGELGPDGDRFRFSTSPREDTHCVNLRGLGDRLIGGVVYDGGATPHGPSEHVAAWVLGDLESVVVRVDDYPTGVRPIGELGPLHDVLREIDDAGMPYHLGIVPALLTPEMSGFLRSLKHMVPTMHGFNHRYPEMSQRLIEQGDPGNQRGTVGGFNEFKGVAKAEVRARLSEGKARLEQAVGLSVYGYIPPCNEGDRVTGQALEALGFRYILSEKPLPGCRLRTRASDFYGRSTEFSELGPGSVASLHATWEVDVKREGRADALGRMLRTLQATHNQGVKRAQALATRLGFQITGSG